jgi:hypothetical protein
MTSEQPESAVEVTAETYALGLLVEEAGESAQMVGKWLRFGPDHTRNDGVTARKLLPVEVGDLLAAIDYATAAGVLDPDAVAAQRARKFAKLTNAASCDDEGRRLAPSVEAGFHRLATQPAEAQGAGEEHAGFLRLLATKLELHDCGDGSSGRCHEAWMDQDARKLRGIASILAAAPKQGAGVVERLNAATRHARACLQTVGDTVHVQIGRAFLETLLAAAAPQAPAGGEETPPRQGQRQGWDQDGMCDDHYQQECKECALPTPQRADAEDVERAVSDIRDEMEYARCGARPDPDADRHVRVRVKHSDLDIVLAALAAIPRASQQAGRTEREVAEGIIAALRAEQERCDSLDHILDTSECIAVIEEWASLQPAREGREG